MKSLFKHAVVAFSVAVISLVGVIDEAQAARLGVKISGMQRTTQQTTPNSAQNPTVNTPARNPVSERQHAQQRPKPSAARRWMGAGRHCLCFGYCRPCSRTLVWALPAWSLYC